MKKVLIATQIYQKGKTWDDITPVFQTIEIPENFSAGKFGQMLSNATQSVIRLTYPYYDLQTAEHVGRLSGHYFHPEIE